LWRSGVPVEILLHGTTVGAIGQGMVGMLRAGRAPAD